MRYLAGEKLIAVATSKWVLFDLKEQKITKLTDEIISPYKPESESVFEEPLIKKIKEPENAELSFIYEVKRSDIDMIKHMHNLNYLNLAYEALPEESYFNSEKNNVCIMYKNQILLGEKVKCYYAKQENEEIVIIKNEDDSMVHAIVKLN